MVYIIKKIRVLFILLHTYWKWYIFNISFCSVNIYKFYLMPNSFKFSFYMVYYNFEATGDFIIRFDNSYLHITSPLFARYYGVILITEQKIVHSINRVIEFIDIQNMFFR